MRRFISWLFALVFAFNPILSFATEYASMSDDELLNELDQIRVELLLRTINPEQIMLESNGIVIYLSGEIREEKNYDGTINLVFPIIAVNNGDKNIIGSIREFSINGWEVETYNSIEIDAGKKVKDEFKLKDVYGKTDITSIDKITEIEFYGSTTDPSNNKYITKDLRKTIVFQ